MPYGTQAVCQRGMHITIFTKQKNPHPHYCSMGSYSHLPYQAFPHRPKDKLGFTAFSRPPSPPSQHKLCVSAASRRANPFPVDGGSPEHRPGDMRHRQEAPRPRNKGKPLCRTRRGYRQPGFRERKANSIPAMSTAQPSRPIQVTRSPSTAAPTTMVTRLWKYT